MSAFSILHDLAVLYLALAHGADRDLDPAELVAVSDQLRAWAPGEDPAVVSHVLREAKLTYANGIAPENLDELVVRLGEKLDAPARERVLGDLREIARADQQVNAGEVNLIEHVAASWGQ